MMLIQSDSNGVSLALYLTSFLLFFVFAPSSLDSLTSILGLIGIASMDEDIKRVQMHIAETVLTKIKQEKSDFMKTTAVLRKMKGSSKTTHGHTGVVSDKPTDAAESHIYDKLMHIVRKNTGGDAPGFFISGTTNFVRVTIFVILRILLNAWIGDGMEESLVQTWEPETIGTTDELGVPSSSKCFTVDLGYGDNCTLITKDMVSIQGYVSGTVTSGLALKSADLHTRVVQTTSPGVTDAVCLQWMVTLVLGIMLVVDLASRLAFLLVRLGVARNAQKLDSTSTQIPPVPGAVSAVVAALNTADGLEIYMGNTSVRAKCLWGLIRTLPMPGALVFLCCMPREGTKIRIRFDMKMRNFRVIKSQSRPSTSRGGIWHWVEPLVYEAGSHGERKYVSFNFVELMAVVSPVAVLIGLFAAFMVANSGRMGTWQAIFVIMLSGVLAALLVAGTMLLKGVELSVAFLSGFERYNITDRKRNIRSRINYVFSRCIIIYVCVVLLALGVWLAARELYAPIFIEKNGIPIYDSRQTSPVLASANITAFLGSPVWDNFYLTYSAQTISLSKWSEFLAAGFYTSLVAVLLLLLSRIFRAYTEKRGEIRPPIDEPCPDEVIWNNVIKGMASTGILANDFLSLVAVAVLTFKVEGIDGDVLRESNINWPAVHLFYRSSTQRGAALQTLTDLSENANCMAPVIERLHKPFILTNDDVSKKINRVPIEKRMVFLSQIESIVLNAILKDPTSSEASQDVLGQIQHRAWATSQQTTAAHALETTEQTNPLAICKSKSGSLPRESLAIGADVGTTTV